MSNQEKYNIPVTRKDKIEFLRGFMNGEKTIEDLQESGYSIELWKQDESDPDFFQTFDGTKRISRAEHEEKKLKGAGH